MSLRTHWNRWKEEDYAKGEREGTNSSARGEAQAAEGSAAKERSEGAGSRGQADAAGGDAAEVFVGAIVLAKVEAGEIEEATLKQWLRPALSKPEDRVLFGLDTQTENAP